MPEMPMHQGHFLDAATALTDHITAQLLAMTPAQRARVLTDLFHRFPPPDAVHAAEAAPQDPVPAPPPTQHWWPWD